MDRWLRRRQQVSAVLLGVLLAVSACSGGQDGPADSALTGLNRYLDEHNADPKPFTWTATPAATIAKLDQANASLH